jgi:D-3-phosphoglycerate dehydrogenase / 2-oxoglutarate reductase
LKKIKVVVTDYIEPDLKWEENELKKYSTVDFQHYQLKFKPIDEVISRIEDAEIIVVNMVPLNKEIIKKLKNCKLIIRHGIGYDNVDVNACTEAGIILANIPDYCVEEVAEQAVMLLFACSRKILIQKKVLTDSAARGEWDFKDLYPIFRVREKKLGIIGCGRIGSVVLSMARGLGMNVKIHDPYLSEERLKELNIKNEDLDLLLSESDFISVHCPLNDETKEMFDYGKFKKMKPTAFFINTARGGIIKTEDLIQALKDKILAGARIDVYTGKEPPSPDSPMFKLDNIILSPHISWYSEESGWSIRAKIIDDIKRYLSSEKPRFIVNKELDVN